MSPYPPLRPYARGGVWAQTAAQARAFDADAIDRVGVAQAVLMENAGRAVAQVAHRLYPDGAVVALVGAGNNGGDAMVAARILHSWGRSVTAVLVADRPANDPLLHGWPVAVVADSELDDGRWAELLTSTGVVVDGLLGTGARGMPRDRQASVIRRVNESARPVVAVDVPSGVDATTGATPGDAVRAAVTVSFGAPKLGTLLHPGRALGGRHVVAEIGFPPLSGERAAARVVTPEWARAALPRRGTDTHKNAVGRLTVVAGRVGMAGAAILSVRAAFRGGAGLVRVCSVPENRATIQGAVPEAIFVDASDHVAVSAALSTSDALAVGPGLGTDDAAVSLLRAVLDGPPVPTVLDADALNIAASGSAVDLSAVGSARPLLLTPHPGEMARLRADADLEGGRVEAVAAAARAYGCAVLLKGAPSLVAESGGGIFIDTQPSSDLAVAGMGDVLTGVCGALMAQRLPAATAGSVGLYLSGRAARIAGRGAALMPSDVIQWLPQALVEGGGAESDLSMPSIIFDADPAS